MQKEIKEEVDKFIGNLKKIYKLDKEGQKFSGVLEIEELAKEISQHIGHETIKEFVNIKTEDIKKNNFYCKCCNTKLKKHRKTEYDYRTTFGDININYDVYLYCEKCRSSIRPMHAKLGVNREDLSLELQKTIVDFGIDESGQQSAKKIKRHYPQVNINRSKVIRILHKHGEFAKQFILDKLNNKFNNINSEKSTHFALELEVEYDGGMIPVAELVDSNSESRTPVRNLPKRTKKCYWKEVKVGVVQGVNDKKEDRLYSLRFMNDLSESFEDLLALAHMQDWSKDTNVRGIADGAKYIKTRMEETFDACNFKFILDRPHAKEHLGDVAKELASIIKIDKNKWFDEALKKIENGKADLVISELRTVANNTQVKNNKVIQESKEILLREASYFERNKDSVEYAKYRENGWSTASGEVESGHRHIVQFRLKIPGAWWHPNNVPNILALRMLQANDWLDEYWEMQKQTWNKNTEYLKKINQ